MEIISVENNIISSQDLEHITEVLKKGGIMIYPTDTVYGIGGDGLNTEVIRKIFQIKQRDNKKPLSLLVSDVNMAKSVAHIDARQEQFLETSWPGAVTAILDKQDIVPVELLGHDSQKGIGLRMPNYPIIQAIIKQLNRPLIGTSANISGQETPHNIEGFQEMFKEFESLIDVILFDPIKKISKPSTVIDVRDESAKIVRS